MNEFILYVQIFEGIISPDWRFDEESDKKLRWAFRFLMGDSHVAENQLDRLKFLSSQMNWELKINYKERKDE